MKSLGPFWIDGKTKPYYDVTKATEIIGRISNATLWAWLKQGCTTWGLTLDVVRHPLSRTSSEKPRSDRTFRLLIGEDDVHLLRDLLRDCRNQPQPKSRLTKEELRDLRIATKRARRPPHPNPAI